MLLKLILEKIKYRFVNIFLKIYFCLYFYCTKKCRHPYMLFKLQEMINIIIFILKKRIRNINSIRNNNIFRRKISSYNKQYLKMMVDDYEYLIKLYFTLVDDMIIKYICVDECGQFRQLFLDYSTNTNYNYIKIKEYLRKAKKLYFDNKGYYFICDLSSVNLNCGDIIYLVNDEVNYIELKNYNSNQKKDLILKAINNENVVFDGKYDKEQYKRINKQFKNHEYIDYNFNYPFFGDYPRTARKHFKYKGFINKINHDFMRIERNLFIETKVDDCIKYLMVNNKNKIYGDYDDRKLLIMQQEYKTNGVTCFTYDEFIFDSSVYRPYMLNWSKRVYKKIIKDEVSIYIKINIKNLFNKFEKKVFK